MGRDKLFSVLRESGMLIKPKRRYVQTTDSRHWVRKYPNLISALPPPTRSEQLWVSDITYVASDEGFGYLSLITDAYSKRIMGYAFRSDLTKEGPLSALRMALKGRRYTDQALIHHPDRGYPYLCASGNITSSSPKGIGTLTYDPFIHRTRTIAIGASSMNFQYDGTERRIYRKEVVSGVTSEALYLHDGMNAIHERMKTGTVTEYVYGPTGIIAYGSASTWKYVIKDHLGSTRAVVDGTTVTGYDYSAFGSILAPVTPNTNYMYTGQEYDKTSGLHNYKARMCDSDLMRFYGMDPAGQFSSPFLYVGNNPALRNDPDGKIAPLIAGLIIVGSGIYNAYQNRDKIDNFGKGFSFFLVGGGQATASIFGWPTGAIIGGMLGSGANSA
ncbi:MAG TPA: RHS repeat-associated core domain-containing protein [bacterium]|nr:RHS repeat-associated core domain-containing protein [bacterium]HMY36179.1 RHS repeat-associated core domain-containing protein [bacterium]HMZ03462.1 RHS repeat-associated core domain-containing protein [bacterium]HNB08011.1 RHS repeat-associated core domain-containing protein [bacterium]HNB55355.1 RHS repeat-associated core domain-containing protein [bacterium]